MWQLPLARKIPRSANCLVIWRPQEQKHEQFASQVIAQQDKAGDLDRERDYARRSFVLQIVQPGLAGVMDGSVSTLAPPFVAAFATHDTSNTFRVGLAASVGAAMTMGFAEALSDDGKVSGRGAPVLRLRRDFGLPRNVTNVEKSLAAPGLSQ